MQVVVIIYHFCEEPQSINLAANEHQQNVCSIWEGCIINNQIILIFLPSALNSSRWSTQVHLIKQVNHKGFRLSPALICQLSKYLAACIWHD